MTHNDPTRDELITFIDSQFAGMIDDPEGYELERECAIYWFACDYHGGQTSNLYSVLSTSWYRPGVECGPGIGSLADMIYAELQTQFCGVAK